MGSLVLVQNKSQSVMKVLLLVALVIATVLAEPEADAYAPDDKVALYPGIYGIRLGYATVAANPVVGNPGYALAKSYVPYAGHVHPGHFLGKRSAEASADPAVDDKVAVYPGLTPYHHGYATIAANPVVGNPGYALRKSYVPYGYGHYLGKREAEAAPEASADPEAEAWYGHHYGGYYGGHYGGYYGYPSLPKGVTPIGNQFPYWG